jgi:hypothetical protein
MYIKIKHFWKKENLGEKRKKSFFLFPVLRWGWGGGEGGGHIFKMAGYGGPTALRGLFKGYYKIRFIHGPLTLAFQSINF